ncbi:MAG: hypothetical protein WCF57_20340 [Pyrinomonadaceae bacterium]
MANKNKVSVEIAIDEFGRAEIRVRELNTQIDRVGHGSKTAFDAGGRSADSYAKAVGEAKLAVAALAAVAVGFSAKAIQASAAAEDSNRVLSASATQAGVAYSEAAIKAEDFGRRVGLANTEAARTYAELLRLAGKAGREGDIDLITTRFADLAASRGIQAQELATIAQQIAAGTSDEALNKLGLADPGKLYQDYAAAAGKTSESLSEVEKAQARLNPLLQQAAQFAGESERRLQGNAGQLDTAAAAYQNLTTQVGDAITTSVEFRDTLDVISDALGSLVTSHAQARRELAKGLKTPEQLAQEAREGTGRQVWNAIKGALTIPSAAGAELYDQIRLATGQISHDEYLTAHQGTTNALFNPGQRQYDADVERFKAIQKDITDQDAKAKEAAANNETARAEQARQAQAKVAADAEKKAAKEREAAYKSALGFIDEISARSTGQSNPFVALFTNAETAAERMRERFGALGDDVVKQFTAMEQAAIRQEQLATRIKANLSAVALEFQADVLERGIVGITAEQERQLSILQKRFAAATSAPALRREAESYERGFNPQNAFQLRREEFADFERVKRLRPVGSDEAARTAQKLIDDYILEQTKNLPINARLSPDPLTRQLAADRAQALRASAARSQAEIQDEIRRAEAGRGGVQLAGRELKELARLSEGADRDTIRREFLDITKALDPKELTGALRQGQILALREEAQHQRQLEQEGKIFREQLVGSGGILYQIKDAIVNQDKGTDAGDDDVVRINAQPAYASKAAYDAAHASLLRFNGQTFSGAGGAYEATPSEALSLDEKINALARAHAEGRYFGDIAALATANLPRVGTPVEVNPYAQELFRARPGYSSTNDPRMFHADDPYAQEFMRAGFYNSLRGSEYNRPTEEAKANDFLGVLKQMVGKDGIKIDGKAIEIHFHVSDTLAVESMTGQAPRPEHAQVSSEGRPHVRNQGGLWTNR